MAEKKLFTKLNELILVFCLSSNFQRPQNNDIALPPRLPLVTPPPCFPDVYFWLVVVWKIVDWQPPKAKAPPKSLFFSSFHLVAPNDGTTPPNAIQPGRAFSSTSPLSRPLTVS